MPEALARGLRMVWWPQGVTALFVLWLALEVSDVAPFASGVTYPKPFAFAAGIAATAAAGVAARQRWPLLGQCLVVAALCALVATLDLKDQGSLAIVFALAVTSLGIGQHSSRPLDVAAGLAAPGAGIVIAGARWGWAGAVEFLALVPYTLAPFGAGRILRSRTRIVALLRRDQDERARLAVAGERQRIARELHDVVSHAVSMMVIQAGASRRSLARDPDAATRALLNVETAGRTALEEMRRMLDVLTSSVGDSSTEPAPDLDAIPVLVDHVRATGQRIGLDVRIGGQEGGIPPGAALVAYRVVQEGLTNVVKHARGGTASVVVQQTEGSLRVEVRDNGPGGPPPAFRPGHGLWGMHERVRLYGGTLEAGPAPGGGFQVLARIPLAGVTI